MDYLQQIFTQNQFINHLQDKLSNSLSSIVGALLLFIVGWFIAIIAGSVMRKVMKKLKVNTHLKVDENNIDFEKIISKLTFWFLFIFVIAGTLEQLSLDILSKPLANFLNQVTSFIPNMIGAFVLALIGWLLATFIKNISRTTLEKSNLETKISSETDIPNISTSMSNLFFWLVILLFLPMVLEQLGLRSLLEPIQTMFNEVLTFLPNILGAAMIGFIGYVIAKIASGIISNIVASMATSLNVINNLSKLGINQPANLAKISGKVIFFVIIMPVIIAVFDKLQLNVVSDPATNMLNKILITLPNITFAVLLLVVFYVVFRFVGKTITDILANAGADALPKRMGVEPLFTNNKLSHVVGTLVFGFAMIFGTVEASNLVGFTQVSELINSFIEFTSKIILGGVILILGFWIANAIGKIVANAQKGSVWLGTLVKVVVMGLVIAMGLKSMGIADSIVNMAFGLTLGSVATAFALAFGLGGRESAHRVLQEFLDTFKK